VTWECSACVGRAHSVVTARSSHVRRRGAALIDGSVAAGQRQSAVGGLAGGHREGAGQGGQGWSSPEQQRGVEAVEDASGGSVHRRGESSGGRW
jgi:hypothetical protein